VTGSQARAPELASRNFEPVKRNGLNRMLIKASWGESRTLWARFWIWTAAAIWLLGWPPARSVLFYATGDSTHNTTAPTGFHSGSGWELQGFWGGFLGTPIAPSLLITAKHIDGSVGDAFLFHGARYVTTAFYDDPESDLRIWQVCRTFPAYAPLYKNRDEAGKRLIVLGRGTQRGEAVLVNGALKGWRWGREDNALRWGENRVASVGQYVSGMADLIRVAFDQAASVNEACLSGGDSGGAVFIQDQAIWKLAGINYGVDGPYRSSETDLKSFNASLFDQSGLYIQVKETWTLITNAVPGAFYATRISSRADWIQGIVQAHGAVESNLVLQGADTVDGPYQDDANHTIDRQNKRISLPKSDQARFFRLRGCCSSRISGIRLEGTKLVVSYE
jgi:hypothetical protein